MAVIIPANDLAVALTASPHHPARAQPVATNHQEPRTSTTTPVPDMDAIPSELATASATDAFTNHLHSLLHDSLNRHFVYPAMARRLGWEGRVELRVSLDPEGRVYGLRILRSSGYALLDDDAMQTLQRIGSIPQARAWLPKNGYTTTLPVIYKLSRG